MVVAADTRGRKHLFPSKEMFEECNVGLESTEATVSRNSCLQEGACRYQHQIVRNKKGKNTEVD